MSALGVLLALIVSGLLFLHDRPGSISAAAVAEGATNRNGDGAIGADRGSSGDRLARSARVTFGPNLDAGFAGRDVGRARSRSTAVTGRTASRSSAKRIATGEASYYGRRFAGRPTASGEMFDPAHLTAAHRTLPFGSKVRVTNTANGRSVVVRVNDRGPYVDDRLIDVSRGAAERLGMIASGTAPVTLELIS